MAENPIGVRGDESSSNTRWLANSTMGALFTVVGAMAIVLGELEEDVVEAAGGIVCGSGLSRRESKEGWSELRRIVKARAQKVLIITFARTCMDVAR